MGDEYESALNKTGWGLCHYFLVGLCGMCTLAEAGASLTLIIIAPLLACDMHYGRNEVITINAVSSLGMAFGGFFFGTLADANGRKGSIPITMVVIFCASIGLSFSRTYFLINLFIFMLGVGVASNNAMLRVYFIECLPAKKRGSCLAVIDLLWVMGFVSALGISWALVPSVVRMLGNEFRPSSWRVLAGLGGAPTLVMACAASLLPPSPRYLLHRRRPEQALAVLQQMYAINYSKHADNYPPCDLGDCVEPCEDEDEESRGLVENVGRYFRKTGKRVLKICTPPFARVTALAAFANLLLFPGFGWFALWNAHVLQEIVGNKDDGSYKDQGCIVDTGDIGLSFLRNCHQVNDGQFQLFLLLSASFVIGEVLLVIGIDRVGRRLSTITSGLVGGTAILTLIFASRHVTRIVLASFFLATYATSYTTGSILVLENYPTSVRGTAVGFVRILPHVVGFLAKYFFSMSCLSAIYIVAGLVIGAAIIAIPIPDFTNLPMRE